LQPEPVRHCPCADRNTTLANKATEKAAVDYGLTTAVATCGTPPIASTGIEGVFRLEAPPPKTLHVLHCFWLC
jgi:hypothetical protein